MIYLSTLTHQEKSAIILKGQKKKIKFPLMVLRPKENANMGIIQFPWRI